MNQWFFELFEDSTDPHTPAFHETVAWWKANKGDLTGPDVRLPEPSIGVQIMELRREVAIKTPTMLMEVITRDDSDGSSDGSVESQPAGVEQPV